MHRATSRDRSLADAGRSLERLAPIVRYGLMAVGLTVAVDQVRPLVSDGQFTWGERRIIGLVTLVTLGGFALAGWVSGQLLRAASGIIGSIADGAEASIRTAELIEDRLLPGIERMIATIERSGSSSGPAAGAVAEIRRAIGEGRWSRARRFLDAFGRDHPEAPEGPALVAELAAARRSEVESLRRSLDDAMADDDASAAITCRDSLTLHLSGQVLTDLDHRVVVWLARWIKRRARAGGVEAAGIAALAADRFGDTAEGRALHDALPELRRRAGLCPGCGRTYRGTGEVCPECEAEQASIPGATKPRA